jgi:HEAT repeat protein
MLPKKGLAWTWVMAAGILLSASIARAEDEATAAEVKSRIESLILLLNDKDNAVRQGAVKALGETGSVLAVPALIRAIDDEDSQVKRAAVDALEPLGRPEAIQSLTALLREENNLLPLSAVKALARIKDPRAVESLGWALCHGDDDTVKAAAEELAKLGAAGVEPLAKALQERADVREAAAEALAGMNDPKARAAVATALADPDWRVRLSLIRHVAESDVLPDAPWAALVDAKRERQEIRERALHIVLYHEPPVPAKVLLAAVNDPEAEVRQTVVRALCERGEAAEIRPAMRRALQDRNWIVRDEAISFFGKHLTNEDLPVVSVALLKETNANVATSLVSILTQKDRTKEANDVLAGFMEHPLPEGLDRDDRERFEELQAHVVYALAESGDVRAIKAALRLLDSPSEHVAQRAVEHAAELKGDDAVPVLLKAAGHSALEIRRTAYSYLAERETKNEAVVKQLLIGAADRDEDIRQRSLRALVGQKTAACVPAFVAALGDQALRQIALDGLARCGLPEAVPPLAKVLDSDPRDDLSGTLLDSLAESGNPGAVDLWIKVVTEDSDRWYRIVAARALGRLRDRKAIEPLQKVLATSSDPDLRQKAVNALVQIDEVVGYQPKMDRVNKSPGGSALAEAIKATGEKGYVAGLRKVLEKRDRNATVLRMAMNDLQEIEGERAIPLISTFLRHREPELAEAAVRELEQLGVSEQKIQEMIQALPKPDSPR